MSRRRPTIQPRVPVFLGCEGKSEHGYGTLLGQIARETQEISVHIRAEELQPGAGDPLALIEKAGQKIREIERRRVPFAYKAVLLDPGTDEKTRDANVRARELGIEFLIWQDPDHEALLLRHLPDCQQLRPAPGASLEELRRRWPNYQKGMSASRLRERIGIVEIRLASNVEPRLRIFCKGSVCYSNWTQLALFSLFLRRVNFF